AGDRPRAARRSSGGGPPAPVRSAAPAECSPDTRRRCRGVQSAREVGWTALGYILRAARYTSPPPDTWRLRCHLLLHALCGESMHDAGRLNVASKCAALLLALICLHACSSGEDTQPNNPPVTPPPPPPPTGNEPSGLDARPANTTCLAGDAPGSGVSFAV